MSCSRKQWAETIGAMTFEERIRFMVKYADLHVKRNGGVKSMLMKKMETAMRASERRRAKVKEVA